MKQRIKNKIAKRLGLKKYSDFEKINSNASNFNYQFYIPFVCSILILIIGIYLKLTNKIASGYAYGRLQPFKLRFLSGNLVIFIGIALLLFILYFFIISKSKKL